MMRISKEDKELLREKILTEALPFLKKSGSAGAPVDEIMKQAGLTSGALYSHFKSKEDLFVQVLLKELDRLIEIRKKEFDEYGTQALSRLIDSYLSKAHVNDVKNGCVFSALGADMHKHKASIRGLYEEKMNEMFEILAKSFKGGSAQEKKEKSQFVYSSLIGTMIQARTMKNADKVDELLTSSKKILHSLIG